MCTLSKYLWVLNDYVVNNIKLYTVECHDCVTLLAVVVILSQCDSINGIISLSLEKYNWGLPLFLLSCIRFPIAVTHICGNTEIFMIKLMKYQNFVRMFHHVFEEYTHLLDFS